MTCPYFPKVIVLVLFIGELWFIKTRWAKITTLNNLKEQARLFPYLSCKYMHLTFCFAPILLLTQEENIRSLLLAQWIELVQRILMSTTARVRELDGLRPGGRKDSSQLAWGRNRLYIRRYHHLEAILKKERVSESRYLTN